MAVQFGRDAFVVVTGIVYFCFLGAWLLGIEELIGGILELVIV